MFSAIRLPTLVLVAVIAALTFAACSVAAEGPGVATLDDPGASGSPAASTAPTDPQEAFLAYAQCMRDHGIDMPDPQVVDDSDGEGKVGMAFSVGDGGGSIDKEKFRAADTACKPLLANVVENGPMTEISPEDEEKLLQFARCMRDHGIDMPDPQLNGGGMTFNEEAGTGPKLDPSSAEFQAAQEACGGLLPGKIQTGGAGQGGGGPETGPANGGVAVPAGPTK
jgi:hypothetical protein